MNSRQRDFKKGISGEDSRRKREDQRLALRRKDRRETLHKRRTGAGRTVRYDDPVLSSQAATDETDLKRLVDLPQILAGINSQNTQLQYDKVMQIRKMLSIEMNPPIQPIIEANIVPKLINFLQCDASPGLQFEASWALTNIASGTTEHTRVIIDNGAVPIFIKLLLSNNYDVREQAVWALGNIAGDSPECRNLVLEAGILQPLLALCSENSKITLLRNATWTLSNLCRGKPQVPFEAIKSCLPTLSQLLYVQDEEVLTDACWAFSYISDDMGPQNEKISEVIKCGAVPRLTHLLGHKANSVKHPALRTLGNIVTGNEQQTQVVINNAALPRLLTLLNNPKKAIRKEACWTISNITAGSIEQIEAVIQNSLFQPVIRLLQQGEFDVKKEAAWAISNATSGGSPQQIRFLVNQNCITPLCNLLTSNNNKVVMVALEGLENILRVGENDRPHTNNVNLFAQKIEECKGLENMERLHSKENLDEEICERVLMLIAKYFGVQDDVYLMDGPQVDKNNNMFQFGGGNTGGGSTGDSGAAKFNF